MYHLRFPQPSYDLGYRYSRLHFEPRDRDQVRGKSLLSFLGLSLSHFWIIFNSNLGDFKELVNVLGVPLHGCPIDSLRESGSVFLGPQINP